jgi:hypothetical protein
MTETTGEYWTFSAECIRPFGDVSGKHVAKGCNEELDPAVCMDCKFCELTYAPDVLAFTPDFKMEE